MPDLVPVNHSVADAHLAANLKTDNLPNAPAATDLDNTEDENYELDLTCTSSMGFPVLTVAAGYKSQVLLHGTSRWLDVTQADHTYRFGVAVRVIVNVSTVTGTTALTLPAIAAKVELNQAFASAQVLVRGYKGVAKRPRWSSFGVESFGEYKQAVDTLEDQVFNDTANIVPELLATTVNSQANGIAPRPAEAVGSVIALHGIARGHNRAHTLEHLPSDDDGLQAAVQAVYAARIGDSLFAVPNEDQKHAAQTDLYGLAFAPEFMAGLRHK